MSSNDRPQDTNPFRRPAFLAAAVFLVLVAVFGLVVTLGGENDDTRASAPPTSAPTPGQTGGVPTAGTSSCGVTDRDQSIPTTAPADVSWSVFKTVAVPTSRSAGPGIIEGDVARCYAHTPRGALIAAWQIGVRSLLADQWREVAHQQVLPGPGRDTYERERVKVTTSNDQPGQYGQAAGFKFVTYTPEIAVIEVVSRFSSSRMQATTTTVSWSGEDWKLQLQPDGSPSPSAHPVASLAGFVPWGGI